MRLQGNALFARQNYSEAINLYTQSLVLHLDAKTLGIRSQAHFLSNHFSLAYCDASHALALVDNEDNNAAIYRKRQSNAEKHLFELASKTNHCSSDFFSSALEVFDAPKQGRGLRTTRSVSQGELLVIGSPLVCTTTQHNVEKPKALQEMADKLMQCKDNEVLQCVNDLDDGTDGSAEQIDVKQVLKRNTFQLTPSRFALYHMASLVNHACDANLVLVFFGSTLVLRAAVPLNCGEQVTIRYFATNDMFTDERQARCKETWGFTCECNWCQHEPHNADEAMRKEANALCALFFKGENLAEVANDLKKFVTKLDLSNVYRLGAFAGVLQVYRACMENVGNVHEAIKMQDLLMDMFDKLEPSSFEHCKLATLCELFTVASNNGNRNNSTLESKRVHETRYGREPLLLEHAMQQSKLALLTKSPQEWTLNLA